MKFLYIFWMKVCQILEILRGFGYDEFGYPFSDYGVELNFINNKLDNVTLNMYDRNVSINYFNE